MKFLFSSMLACSIISSVKASSFCQDSRVRTAAEHIADFDPSVELDLVNLNLFDAHESVVGYEYEVVPAFTNGLYARTDRWQIGTRLGNNDRPSGPDALEWRIGASANHASEASFIRFFRDACHAELAKPRTPRQIPLTAQRAIGDDFAVGQYFIFKASTSFVVSGEILQLLGSSTVGIGAHAAYLVQGAYQVHIVRQDAKHVRLKVIARRGREGDLGLSLGVNEPFEVFGLSPLDRELTRQMAQPVRLTYTQGKAQVFLVDYVLDLSNAAVADAFNKFLRQARYLRSVQLANPLLDMDGASRSLILDFAPIEDLYRADVRNNNVARLRRNLRTSAQQNARTFSVDLGNRLLGYEFDATTSTSRVTLRDADDTTSHYILRSYDRIHESRMAFTWARLYTKRSLEILLKADQAFADLTTLNIAQTLERRDKRLDRSEFDAIRMTLRKLLPADIYATIPFGSWNQGQREMLRNFGMRFQLVLGPAVILQTPLMPAERIATLYADYIRGKGFGPSDFFHVSQNVSHPSPEQRYKQSLQVIARKLAMVSDTSLADVQRLEAFLDLRDNTLFSQTGIGFLLGLRAEQTYRLDLNITANERSLNFQRGDESTARFYRQMLLIKAALQNDGVDLRREAEALAI